jgi:GMP synthase (glutamine-hydrolysing)
MAWHFKGNVVKCDHREYGFAQIQMSQIGRENEETSVDALFESLGNEMQVRQWGQWDYFILINSCD